jgi:hypothetical protein
VADQRDWSELTRREKDGRRVEAYKAGVRDLKKAFEDGGMSREEADRKARRDQETISNKSWATYQRSDGHK